MPNLEYTEHEKISLAEYPEYDEAWLQTKIADDPTILGIGASELLQRERTNFGAGRLDLLLSAPGDRMRFEVELMLGQTDPSHIIRCIEYWDVERRRYPAYDHVAVLVAEDVTHRFLSILSLFAGNIPLVVLQLNALKVGDKLVLNFTKILDQKALRRDDQTASKKGKISSRKEWIERSCKEIIEVVDSVVSILAEKAKKPVKANYNKQYVGLMYGSRSKNFVWFHPRKKFVRINFSLGDPSDVAGLAEQLEEDHGLPTEADDGTLKVTIKPDDFETYRGLIEEISGLALTEFES